MQDGDHVFPSARSSALQYLHNSIQDFVVVTLYPGRCSLHAVEVKQTLSFAPSADFGSLPYFGTSYHYNLAYKNNSKMQTSVLFAFSSTTYSIRSCHCQTVGQLSSPASPGQTFLCLLVCVTYENLPFPSSLISPSFPPIYLFDAACPPVRLSPSTYRLPPTALDYIPFTTAPARTPLTPAG